MFKLKMIKKPILFKLKCDFTFPPIVLANMQEKETTPTKETQVVVADFPFDGLSKLTVNAIPDEYIIPDLGTKTITTNGTYNATDDNLDGYSQVSVETSGVDINDYFETTYSGTSPNKWVINNFVKKSPDLVIDDSVTSIASLCNSSPIAPKIICNSNVKNMSFLYSFNKSKIIDVSGLNTSNVTDMSYMFNGCSSLTSLDVSNFDTSNVTNMSSMFGDCSKLTNLDLSNFDTSKVKNMLGMFYRCSSLTSLDLRNFDFSKVTSYNNMFYNVPTDCLIIVKDDTAKTWITSKFTTLTNVKTVAELEQQMSILKQAEEIYIEEDI